MSAVFPRSETVKEQLLDARGTACGCLVSDGKILPQPTFGKYSETAIAAKDAAYMPSNKLFYMFDGTNAYLSATPAGFTTAVLTDVAAPFAVCERTAEGVKLIIADAERYALVTGSGAAQRTYAAPMRGGVLKCGRLFGRDATDSYKIIWSGSGTFSDFKTGMDGAGYVTLDTRFGPVSKLLLFGEDIAVVCSAGIARLTAFGSPENFKLTYCDRAVQGIAEGSAKVLGDKLYFVAADGLYRYSGNTCERLPSELVPRAENIKCAAAWGGRYYLGCSLDGDGAVIVYDPASGAEYALPVAPTAFSEADRLFAYCPDGVYVLGGFGDYTFESRFTDFSKGGKKFLSELYIDCEEPVDITVSNGVNSRIFGGVCGKVKVKMSGKKFRVTVKGGCAIYGIYAYAEVCRDI